MVVLLVVDTRFLVADGVDACHGDEAVSEDVTPKADVLPTGVQPADRMVVIVGMRKWQLQFCAQPTHPTRLQRLLTADRKHRSLSFI